MSLFPDLLMGLALGGANNLLAGEREHQGRAENYTYNELAADNADRRTRALYNELYSPQAQMQQIKNAGLSPSVFYGNAGGISGQTGAQGAGASGIAPTTFGIDPLSMSQVKLNEAQARKLNAEADTEEGTNERGIAGIANIWANTAEANENAELLKASRILTNAHTRYQNWLNGINERTTPEQESKIRHEARLIANNAEEAYWTGKKAELEFEFSEETYNANKTLLYEQISMLIEQQGVARAEAEKIATEIWQMPDYLEISRMNAENYADWVEATAKNLPDVLEVRKQELNVEKWKIGVGAFTESMRTLGYFFGASQLGDGGQLMDETSTSYDKKGKPISRRQTTRKVTKIR